VTGLQLGILTTKLVYRGTEDVITRVYLINTSESRQVVNSRFALNAPGQPGELELELTGPSGQAVLFAADVNVGKPRGADFTVLAPTKLVGKQYGLRFYFGLTEAGEYAVTAKYHNTSTGEDQASNAWTGSLQSGSIRFRIDYGVASSD